LKIRLVAFYNPFLPVADPFLHCSILFFMQLSIVSPLQFESEIHLLLSFRTFHGTFFFSRQDILKLFERQKQKSLDAARGCKISQIDILCQKGGFLFTYSFKE